MIQFIVFNSLHSHDDRKAVHEAEHDRVRDEPDELPDAEDPREDLDETAAEHRERQVHGPVRGNLGLACQDYNFCKISKCG